eukprot:g1395.t1
MRQETQDVLGGVFPDLAGDIFQSLNTPVEVGPDMPWNRLLTLLESGAFDVLAGAYLSKPRQEKFGVSQAVMTEEVGVFVRKALPERPKTLQDLIGLRGIVPFGASFGEEFDSFAADNLTIDRQPVDEPITYMRLLVEDKADYLVIARQDGAMMISEANASDHVEELPWPAAVNTLHFLFSRATPCISLLERFNAVLEARKKSGALEALIKVHQVLEGAGFVKGLVGFGLPTIGLGLMTVFVGVEKAMVLILWPAFLTNFWQGLLGGHLRLLLKRIWPFLISSVLMLGAGTFILTRLPEGAADVLLGILMIAYAMPMLAGARLFLPDRLTTPIGVAVGLVNGILAGLTGSYTVPGVMYLQAVGLPRDQLIQAMGLLFLLSTLALGVSLGSFGLVGGREAFASLALVIPALSGVWFGQKIRRNISEAAFRRLVLAAILALGLYLLPLGAWRLMA